jgi:phosphoribosylamine--glycine ligase
LKKYLFISALGDSIALALQLLHEGNGVRYYCQDRREIDVADGLIEKVSSWQPSVSWADIIFVDDVSQEIKGSGKYLGGKIAEMLRKRTKKTVFGGTEFGDRLENDRIFAQDVFEKAGLDIVPMTEFHDFKKAIKFVEKNKGAWAIKHCGQIQRDLNGVFWTPEEVIQILEWQEANWKDLHGGTPHFVLQEAVKGVEIAITGWVKDGKIVEGTVFLNQEIKKTMNDDFGPSSGQVGEVGRFLDDPKIYEKTLEKIAPMLKDGYNTFFDINCIVTKDKIVPLEGTSRPGYPTCQSFAEGLDMDLGEFFEAVISGDEIEHTDQYVSNVVIATGTFPFTDDKLNREALVSGMDKIEFKHLWPNEVRYINGQMLGAGTVGYLAVVTARGKTIEDSTKLCYERVKKIRVIPFAKVRTDIGAKAEKDWPKLKDMGWLS